MKETGKSQFPYMKDPNTGKSMLESSDIIQYLFEQYGDGQASPLAHSLASTVQCRLQNRQEHMQHVDFCVW